MKNSIIKLFVGLVATLTVSTTIAQQQSSYAHYAFNTLSVNPAYAGSREVLSITTLFRSQWVGFKGAPQTQTLTVHSPFRDNSMGLGLSLVNDKIGPINSTGVSIDYAYRLRFNRDAALAFGLKSSVNFMSMNLNDLVATDGGDQNVQQSARSQVNPNFGFGMYYSNKLFFVGASTPTLLENELKVQNIATSEALMKRHYYFNAGAAIKLNAYYSFKPSVQLKMVPGSAIQADFTALFTIPTNFELGLTYRTNDAIGFLAGIIVNNRLRIGYGYDYSVNVRTGSNNAGSHELMLRYEFQNKGKNAVVSPRNF